MLALQILLLLGTAEPRTGSGMSSSSTSNSYFVKGSPSFAICIHLSRCRCIADKSFESFSSELLFFMNSSQCFTNVLLNSFYRNLLFWCHCIWTESETSNQVQRSTKFLLDKMCAYYGWGFSDGEICFALFSNTTKLRSLLIIIIGFYLLH